MNDGSVVGHGLVEQQRVLAIDSARNVVVGLPRAEDVGAVAE